MKPPNKAGRPAAEAVERRAEAKENANRCHTRRTQCRESVSQVPERVRKAARQPSNIRGGSRMRASRTYGSMRGAPSNGRPYRNRAMQARLKAKIAGFGCVPPSIICGCRRWPSAQAQSEISEPNPYRARNRKFESISLQRRVRCELNLGKDGFADEIAAAPSRAGAFQGSRVH